MARTYKRDSNGRFASGGGGSARPKARSAPRGQNRLTRSNAGTTPAAKKAPKAEFDKSAWERRVKRSTAVGDRPIAAQGTKVTANQAKRLRKSFETSARAAAFYKSVAEGAASGKYGKGAGAMRASLAARTKKAGRKDAGKRIEESIAGIASRRVRSSASPEKQWKSLQTQERAAKYLRAAGKFAAAKGVPLKRALQSGPKKSTAPKRRRRR
jgi:hypothetical protein